MKERNRLGYRIRSHREQLGLSKSEFSRRVGVTPTAVHNWEENGIVPRREMMKEICRVLRVSEPELHEGTIGAEKTSSALPDQVGSPEDAIQEAKRIVAAAYQVSSDQVAISISL